MRRSRSTPKGSDGLGFKPGSITLHSKVLRRYTIHQTLNQPSNKNQLNLRVITVKVFVALESRHILTGSNQLSQRHACKTPGALVYLGFRV